MKSLLVDALRAANDNSDDGLSLEETIAPGLPAAPAEEKPPAGADIETDLELLDTVAVEIEDEVADNDALFDDEEPTPEVSIDKKRAAPAPETAPLFERAAKWMPVVCLLLVACSAAAYSGWSSMTGLGNGTFLGSHTGPGNSAPVDAPPAGNPESTRFEFIEETRTTAPRAWSNDGAAGAAVAPETAAISVVRNPQARGPRSIAGMTDVDNANFSSVAAIYQAYVSGQINQAALDRLLGRAATAGNEDTELEIKLLLQRYPDSASLHNALGTVLANNARWPEARVAYERAVELAQSAPGSSLQ